MGDFEVWLSGQAESPMKHHPFKIIILILSKTQDTVFNGQFKWGACLLKSNGGVYKVG